MFGSEILEIFIGLSFIYVLLSLLTSTVNELVMAMLDARGQHLKRAIEAMLDDEDTRGNWLTTSTIGVGLTLWKPIKPIVVPVWRIFGVIIQLIWPPIKRLIRLTGLGQASATTQAVSLPSSPPSPPEETFRDKLNIYWQKTSLSPTRGKAGWSQDVFGHPLFKKLRKPGSKRFPSYVSAANFSRILLDELSKRCHGDTPFERIKKYLEWAETKQYDGAVEASPPGSPPDDPPPPGDATRHDGAVEASPPGSPPDNPLPPVDATRLLLGLIEESRGSIEFLKSEVERWYNDVMERSSGWYKRKTQIAIFFIGLIVSFAFNADTIKIAKALRDNPQARAQIVDMAVKYAESQPKDSLGQTTQDIDSLFAQLKTLVDEQVEPAGGLVGMGWEGKISDRFEAAWNDDDWFELFALKLAGWFLTALAVSLGAPFWFDVLSKAINLRGAAKPADKPGRAAAGSAAVG